MHRYDRHWIFSILVVVLLMPVAATAASIGMDVPAKTYGFLKAEEKNASPLETLASAFSTPLKQSPIILVSVEAVTHANPNSTFGITDIVKNTGRAQSVPYTLRYYLSKKPSILADPILIGERNGTPIPPGSQKVTSSTFSLPADLAFGTYYLGAQLIPAEGQYAQTPASTRFDKVAVRLSGSTPMADKGAPVWEKTFGTTMDEFTWEVNAIPGDGFVVTGRIINPAGDSDILALRYEKDGTLAWKSQIGGPGNQTGTCNSPTADGGFLTVGDTMAPGETHTHAYAVRLDSSGKKVWESIFGTGLDDRFFCQETTDDGGFIFNGHTHSFGAGNGDAWLVKVDSSGHEVWNRTYGGPDEDAAWDVVRAKDGGFVVVGRTESEGKGSSDIWVLKVDKNGNEIWKKTFGGEKYESGRVIKATSDGNFIIAGSTESFGNGEADFYCLKIDQDGNVLFEKTFGGPKHDSAAFVAETKDGGYLFAGHTYSYGVGNSDGWLVKLDNKGRKVWDKTYGGLQFDSIISLARMSDGGFVFVGDTYSSGNGGSDIWIGRLGPSVFVRQ